MAGTVTIAGLGTLTSISLTDTIFCVGSIASGGAFRASPLVLQSGLVFGASGASHSPGTVPDPGATAGTTRFLREDSTWSTVTAGGSSLAITQGTLTVSSTSSLTIAGAGGTLTSGGAGQATLTVNSSGGTSYSAGANISISAGTIAVNQTGFPVDLYSYSAGTLAASQVLLKLDCLRAYSAPLNLAGSSFKADTPATASTTLTVSNAGTTAGLVVFPASSSVGTATLTAATWASGSVLSIGAPATPDTTLAGVRIGLTVTR